MMGPWEKYQQPDDPYQITQPVSPTQQVSIDNQRANTTRTNQEIQNNPLNVASTQTNIAQGQQGLRLDRVKAATGLVESFRNDPTVKAYREVMPQVAAAEQARPDGSGDLTVVYSWAKAMDPTGSVRDSDTALAQSASGPLQRARFLISQYHLDKGGTLPPEVRVGLTEEMRNKADQLNHQYSAVHDHYVKAAQASGLDPSIIGPHEGAMYRQQEEAYIRAHGGTPKINGVPVAEDATIGGFGLQADPTRGELTPQQAAAYDAWWAANPNPTPEQLRTFGHSINVNIANPESIIQAKKSGRGISHTLDNTDPRVLQRVDELKRGGTDAGQAANQGVGQGVTLNSSDEINAFGRAMRGSLTGQGSFSDLYNINEQANQRYLGDLQQAHPLAYGVGEFGGGAVLAPVAFGASSPLELAALGTGYGGVAGFNSGQGGIGNRISSGVTGAVAGGVTGVAAPEFLGAGNLGRMLAERNAAAGGSRFAAGPKIIPPLVDPITGRLNEPLEAAGPAARVKAAKEFGIDLPMGSAGDRTAAVIERKLDVRPASAGAMNDVRRVVEGQVQNAAEGVAGQFGSARTKAEGGAAIQSAALARNDRAATVIGRAYDAIPIKPTAPASVGNATAELMNLTGRFSSNPKLAEAMHDPQLARYLDAFQSGNISWQDLKQFRSIIGEKIGSMRFNESSSTSDLRALYGALSEDMRATAQAQGPGALRAFERANNLNRQNEELIQGALTRILGNDGNMTPNQAAANLQTMTMGGKRGGDLKTLAQIRSATAKSGAWDEVVGTLIRVGGQPADSPGRAFDPATFVRWYSDMDERARALLFKPELRKSLDQFVAVNQRLANSNALRNTSNTAMASPTGTFSIPTAGAALFTGHPMIAAGILLGTVAKAGSEYGMAKLWSKPEFVQWATGYSRAVASGSAPAVKSQVGRLAKLAATNPELREPVQTILRQISNDNFVTPLAAQPNQEQNQQ